MTQQETVRLLAMLRIRYPTAKLWEQDANLTTRAWHMTLADVDYAVTEPVLLDWCRSETWPPDPAEIRTRVRSRQRDERSARQSAELIESYRLPALGDGWMARAKQANRPNEETALHVMELATAWRLGELGLDSIRRQCSGWERFVAMNHAREQVRDLIDALATEDDARCGSILTPHGTFTTQDLREQGGILTTINGRKVLRWPVTGGHTGYRYGAG